MFDSWWQDIRYAARVVRNNPGFSAVIILCLALGIGPSTVTFSLINATLLHPVDVENAGGLVTIESHRTNLEGRSLSVSYPIYTDLRDRAKTVEAAVVSGFRVSVRTGDSSQLIDCAIVSPNFFDILGRKAMIGDVFHMPENDTPGSLPYVVLGYGFWQEYFHEDPSIVNTLIRINGHDFTVAGVMPKGFTGHAPVVQPPLWAPTTMMDQIRPTVPSQLAMRNHFWMRAFGRMRPGATLAQVNDELASISRELKAEFPQTNEFLSFSAVPFTGVPPEASEVLGGLVLLAGIVVFLVLLLSCSSTAAMQLARATVRRREIAIQMAVGAGRLRIIRQLLVESVFIALLAGGVALLLSLWAFELYRFAVPERTTSYIVLGASLDYRVLAFSAGVSVLAGILFGLTPAWHMSKPDLLTPLKIQDPGGDFGSARMRNVLVAAQFAMAVFLLICAGLFIQSLRGAQSMDPGFETKRMVVFETDLSLYGYSSEKSQDFLEDLVAQLEELPGIESISASRFPPLSFANSDTFATPINEDLSSGERFIVGINNIGPGYFAATGIEMVAGRDFTLDDKRGAEAVIIVNETLAKRYGSNEAALGKMLSQGGPEAAKIVGVVKDSKYGNIGEEAQPFVYLPLRQFPSRELAFCMRTDGDAKSMVAPITAKIRSVNGDLAVNEIRTIQEQTRLKLWPARVSATLFTVLGVLALILAVTSVYGVVSYSVARRKLEIGIRMALGGEPRDLVILLVKRGLRLVVIGAAVGVAIAFGATRFLAPLLSGGDPTDLRVFTLVPLVLLIVATLAIFLPARKATSVDPMVVLRYE